VSSREVVKVIADILAAEMALAPGQIMLSAENYEIPTTEGLYIAVSYISTRPVGVTTTRVPDGHGGMTEIQEASFDHAVQVDVMSYNDDARLRREEVLLALGSQTSQFFQEQNSIQISRHCTPFIDLSTVEETRTLKRYTTSFRVKAVARKSKSGKYYDTFLTPEVHANA
jgi:hypothetical protein